MIEGKITTEHPNAETIAKSLIPDNIPNVKTEVMQGEIVTHISVDKLNSLIATVDDYLMNLKIADEICGLTVEVSSI
jgi:tRNA threonylcarbamoyladenosine modification (KEOPS) complex  Pcc1 subunit